MKNWHSMTFHPRLAGGVPQSSGIYAMVRVDRLHGLPIEHEILYIGQSVDLRRRYEDHVRPWRAGNPLLAGVSQQENTEFWFRPTPVGDLDRIERQLIRRASPVANRITFTS